MGHQGSDLQPDIRPASIPSGSATGSPADLSASRISAATPTPDDADPFSDPRLEHHPDRHSLGVSHRIIRELFHRMADVPNCFRDQCNLPQPQPPL